MDQAFGHEIENLGVFGEGSGMFGKSCPRLIGMADHVTWRGVAMAGRRAAGLSPKRAPSPPTRGNRARTVLTFGRWLKGSKSSLEGSGNPRSIGARVRGMGGGSR